MNCKPSTLALAAALLLAGPAALAATLDYGGTTVGGATFNRPVETLDFVTMTDTAYSAFEFTVGSTGFYNFLSTAQGGWDNFVLLYGPSFNPTQPLTGALVANDDLGGTTIGQAGFSWGLTAGVRYTFVTTGVGDSGLFSNSITGPGSIAAVPEPSTYLMLAMGLAAIGYLRRRR